MNRSFALVLLAFPAAATAQNDPPPFTGPIQSETGVGGFAVASENEHSISNYWVEGEDGMLVIDAHWRLSEAKAALAHMREETNAAIAAVLITHAHSDHFGGLPVFVDEGTSIIASPWTARSIAVDAQGFRANREAQFGNDFADTLPAVDTSVTDGEAFVAAGVTIVPRVFASGEAIETAIYHLPDFDALFTGDIVNAGTLPFLYQGGIDAWIDQLKEIQGAYPEGTVIYPGHGAPGPAEDLIETQLAILELHRDLIIEALDDDGAVDSEERSGIVAGIRDAYPDARQTAGLPTPEAVIEANIDGTLRGWRIASAQE